MSESTSHFPVMLPGEVPAEGLLDSPAPWVSVAEAESIMQQYFGIRGQAMLLASERDTNFHILARDGRGYALKFANPAEPASNTNFQTEALLELARVDPTLPVPRVMRSLDGICELRLPLSDGRSSVVRVLSWVEGIQVVKVPVSAALRSNIGRILARLGAALRDFDHPAAGHFILWDIKNAGQLRPMIDAIAEQDMREQILAELDHFEVEVAPRLAQLRQQVVHNDLNHHNIVVAPSYPESISGILDFGDMVKTPLIIDVAVAASYLTCLDEDPLISVSDMVAAYHAQVPLMRAELELLRDLIVLRLATSITITSWRAVRYPHNATYILRNNGPARVGMQRFATLSPERVTRTLLKACGQE